MKTVEELHEEAMELAELAYIEGRNGRNVSARELNRKALDLEIQAVNMIEPEMANEPTRSVLYRSAATLAFECDRFAAAIRLAKNGLIGHPPKEIELELRELVREANLRLRSSVKAVGLVKRFHGNKLRKRVRTSASSVSRHKKDPEVTPGLKSLRVHD